MVAYNRFFDEPFDPEAERWLDEMITLSGNDPADWLMERIDKDLGPLKVTETLQEIGLENTFTAGYFRIGAPMLHLYQTPANLRSDINTRPDPYTQTTASEIGMLLTDIYTCAGGGGTLLAVFPEEIQPDECKQMIDRLSRNKIGWLIEAGVPDGTRVAHKHGWPLSPIDMISDVGYHSSEFQASCLSSYVLSGWFLSSSIEKDEMSALKKPQARSKEGCVRICGYRKNALRKN
jgi:hypothetical protein